MSIDKLNLQSPNLVNTNIEKLAALFPNCITETTDAKSGELCQAIDFDALKQELSEVIVDGLKERYRLEWAGKQQARAAANIPTRKTVRPIKADSVDFDTTQNLYIEGDNLVVLKLLQESYLGKVKMIYIDPPYNTGNDFVYKDNFTQDKAEYEQENAIKNEYNQRLQTNPETSGRYHSDWLTMMYPRLKLARNLLTDDGVIFISIDDNEVHNLRKVCDEVFGEGNFIAQFIWKKKNVVQNDARFVSTDHEYLLCFSKTSDSLEFNLIKRSKEQEERYANPDNDPLGNWTSVALQAKSGNSTYEITFPNGITWKPVEGTFPRLSKESLLKAYEEGRLWFGKEGNNVPRLKKYLSEVKDGVISNTVWLNELVGSTQLAKENLKSTLEANVFDTPKPINFIKRMMELSSNKDSIILDFFSGSATTAHAVMQLNAEDGGNRKFIMVQVPEATDEKSEAFKAGYKNICEIGKERIRRAAKKIHEEQAAKQKEAKNQLGFENETSPSLDLGFRVYRLDSSNMQDVYYKPQDYKQENLDLFASNIKPDRTSEDLLVQVMLSWGLPLHYKIETLTIQGKQVFKVEQDSLFACFDNGIDEAFAKEIATHTPLRIVFKDDSFKNDTAKENVKQLLKQLSSNTEMKVI